MTARMMYGPQARSTTPADGGAPSSTEADSPAKRQIRAGFQTRSSRTRATMVMSADMMSGKVGPWKLEKRNCEAAKLIPATAMAGSTSMARRKPHMTTQSQSGTMTERKGSCLPTIWLMVRSEKPETCPATMTGTPMAPKATGAVLAIRQMPAAYRGWKPRPTSMAAVMATGVPKPAVPSMKEPKAKAMKMACKRRSSVRRASDCLICSNSPDSTVML